MELEKKISDMEKTKINVDNNLANQVEKKIDTFEKQINNIRKKLEEKNARIAALELSMDDLSKKHLEEKKHKEKKIQDLENMLKIHPKRN